MVNEAPSSHVWKRVLWIIAAVLLVVAANVWAWRSEGPEQDPPAERVRWTWQEPIPETNDIGTNGLDFLEGGAVACNIGFAQSENSATSRIVVLDLATGKLRWRWEEVDSSSDQVIVHFVIAGPGGDVLAWFGPSRFYDVGEAAEKEGIVCFDGATGKMRWKRTSEPGMQAPPTVTAGRLVMKAQRFLKGHITEPYLVCLDGATGHRLWEWQPSEGREEIVNLPRHGLVFPDGDLLVRTRSPWEPFYSLWRLDHQTGQPKWHQALPELDGLNELQCSVAMGEDGDVYVSLLRDDGTDVRWTETIRRSASDGQVRWHRADATKRKREAILLSSQPVGGDHLCVTFAVHQREAWSLRRWLESDLFEPRRGFHRIGRRDIFLHRKRTSDGAPLGVRRIGSLKEDEDMVWPFHAFSWEDGVLRMIESLPAAGAGSWRGNVSREWSADALASKRPGAVRVRAFIPRRAGTVLGGGRPPDGSYVFTGIKEEPPDREWWVTGWGPP